MELLEANEVEVRTSAGENIALFLAERDQYVEDNDIQEEESYFERFHELIVLLTALSKDNSRVTSKKDRSIQKATFRDILDSVESGTRPEISLKFKSENVVLDNWSIY
jgi:hypothetical protein